MSLIVPRFKLVVVDDDAVLATAFSDAARSYLAEANMPGAVLPCAYTPGMQIVDAIAALDPTDILLDVRLGGGNTIAAETLIAALSKKTVLPRVWLMSSYQVNEAHEKLYGQHPKLVQPAWFAKPLWLDEVLKPIVVAARSARSSEEAQAALDDAIAAYSDFPLPVRVFDLSGEIRVNGAWKTAPNQPPLKPFLEAAYRNDEVISPDWWLSPFNGDLEYLEWRLIQLGTGRWLQLPKERQQPETNGIEDIARLTAKVMARGGFPRGRIYTLESVPNSIRTDTNGAVLADSRETAVAFLRLRYYCEEGKLKRALDDDHPAGKVVHPLYGQLAERLNFFLTEFAKKKSLALCCLVWKRQPTVLGRHACRRAPSSGEDFPALGGGARGGGAGRAEQRHPPFRGRFLWKPHKVISAKRHTNSHYGRPGSGPAKQASAVVVRYLDSEKSPKPKKFPLVYCIRQRKDDESGDQGIQYWNRGVPTYDDLHSWLEVPLFSFKSPELVGILVFDRLGSEQVGDAPAAVVTEGLVQTLETTLLKLCHLWRQWRQTWIEKGELQWHRSLDKAQSNWGNLASAILRQAQPLAGQKSLEQAIVDLAVECVQATSGILAIHQLGSRSLRIPAWGGNRQTSPDLSPLFLPLDNPRFLSCRVFNDQKPLHLVDYRTQPEAERLSDEDWLAAGADTAQLPALATWTSKLASVLAYPIIYGGETIAVLTLHKDLPFHFTKLRVFQIRLLSEQIAWMLGVVREVQHRYRWENLLLHNMRAFPMIYMGESRALRSVLIPIQERAGTSLDRIDLATKQIEHIVEGYRWLISGGLSEGTGGEVVAMQTNQELLRLFEEVAKAKKLELHWFEGRAWDIGLAPPFDLVWYNVLSNAIRHVNQGGRVEIRAELEKASWSGEVWNSISADSLPNLKAAWDKEDGQGRPIPQSGTGMGIGLRASRDVCYHIGARLEMTTEKRNGKPGARFTLIWPLSINS